MKSIQIKCLVVDDEKLARTLLGNYIEKLPNLELVGECKNAFEAISVLHAQPVDLVFLDIQMPELTGIEFLNTLQEKPLVIFTTAYQEYALEGYQLDVVDYLLKPFRFDRFLQAVNKAARRLHQEIETLSLANTTSTKEPERQHVFLKANHALHKVYLDEIRYIQGMKEYVAYHLPEQRIITLQSLRKLEEYLPSERFVRIHKSYIVAIDKVTATDGGHVYLGKEKLPIGGNYKEVVQERLF